MSVAEHKTLFHGSMTPGITVFEPRKRFTPGSMGESAPEAIYAGYLPAYAAAHAFPWSSREGFDVDVVEGRVVLTVPQQLQDRIEQPIYVYEVPADAFALLDTNPKGHNFWTREKVVALGCKEYKTVRAAIEENGGEVRIV